MEKISLTTHLKKDYTNNILRHDDRYVTWGNITHNCDDTNLTQKADGFSAFLHWNGNVIILVKFPAPFLNLSVSKIFNLVKAYVRFFESHLYLTAVTAAQLRWHLSNIKVILNIYHVFWWCRWIRKIIKQRELPYQPPCQYCLFNNNNMRHLFQNMILVISVIVRSSWWLLMPWCLFVTKFKHVLGHIAVKKSRSTEIIFPYRFGHFKGYLKFPACNFR